MNNPGAGNSCRFRKILKSLVSIQFFSSSSPPSCPRNRSVSGWICLVSKQERGIAAVLIAPAAVPVGDDHITRIPHVVRSAGEVHNLFFRLDAQGLRELRIADLAGKSIEIPVVVIKLGNTERVGKLDAVVDSVLGLQRGALPGTELENAILRGRCVPAQRVPGWHAVDPKRTWRGVRQLGGLDDRQGLGPGLEERLGNRQDIACVGGGQVGRHDDQCGRAGEIGTPAGDDHQQHPKAENDRGLCQAVQDRAVSTVGVKGAEQRDGSAACEKMRELRPAHRARPPVQPGSTTREREE